MPTAQKTGAGELTEQLTILTTTPVAIEIASITRVDTTATVTTATPHNFAAGDFVTLSGVTPAAYNGEVQIAVTGASTFTFSVAGSPDTPATVPGSVVFTSDAQGGGQGALRTLAVVWGAMRPLSAAELLAAEAVQSTQTYEGTIHYRVPQDVTPKMQVSWTPYGYSTPKVLEIHGVRPDADEPRRLVKLDLGEVVV